MFGSILLASRLHNENQTVLLILLGLVLFRGTQTSSVIYAGKLSDIFQLIFGTGNFRIISRLRNLVYSINDQKMSESKPKAIIFCSHIAQCQFTGIVVVAHIIAQLTVCFIGPFLLTTLFIQYKEWYWTDYDKKNYVISFKNRNLSVTIENKCLK